MSNFIDSNSDLSDLNHIGGKAYNLYLLEHEGLKVPKWFCVSSQIFSRYYHQFQDQILAEIQKIELKNLESLKRASQKIESLFLAVELDPSLKEELKTHIDDKKKYVVRSSAIGEDGTDNSYAGQLSSFLNINSHEVENSIKKCWASIFSERNIQYRLIHGIHTEPAMGVVVQEMIEASCSGVLFTAHPLLGNDFLDQTVINAGYGLGEGVVTDQVEVDTYVFSLSQKKIVDSTYSEKTRMMIPSPDKNGLEFKQVEESKRKGSVLTQTQVKQLAGIGVQLKAFYSSHQDIEWCIDNNDQLYITQARPITTIKKGINKLDFLFDNANIVESFPGVNTPWTLGQIRDIYRITFKKSCLRLGFNRNLINQNNYLFSSLIGMYKGRLFLNLTNWYAMMRFIPYTQKYIETWEEMLGVKPTSKKIKQNSVKNILRALNVFSRVSYYFVTLDLYLKSLDKRMVREFDTFWEGEKDHASLAYTPVESINRIEAFKSTLFEGAELTLINDIYAFVFTALSKKVIETYTSEDPDQIFNRILYGISGMDSIKPLNSLKEMALFVQKNAELLQELKEIYQYPTFNLKLLKRSKISSEFIRLFEDHLQLYGDRGVHELKLETLTYREDPRKLLRLILSYSEADQNEARENQLEVGHFAADKISKLGPRLAFRFFIRMAIRSINYRENFRLHRSRAYGVLRRMTNNLGEKLVALGDIKKARDIYFLEKSDLYNYYSGLTFEYELQSRIDHNKMMYHHYQQDEVGTRYHIRRGEFSQVELEKVVSTNSLQGTGCSSGKVTGEVVVVTDLEKVAEDADIIRDKILVAKMTDPGWVFLMAVAKGLLVEKGSLLSHTAIIGRELGIPTIVGVENATTVLNTGDRIELDADSGEVKVLS